MPSVPTTMKRLLARKWRRLTLEALEERLAPATLTWTGAGTDGNWTTAANWGGTAPVANDSLIFPSGASQLTNNNDFAAGTSFASISFIGSGYLITGNPLTLGGGLTMNATGSDKLNIDLNLPATQTFNVTGGTLIENGAISGAGGLTKVGNGTLQLGGSSNDSYAGPTNVSAGTLQVDVVNTSPIFVSNGATLAGSGFVPNVSSVGGTINPGDAATGILSTSGDVNLDSSSTFAVELDGPTPGSEYDQLAIGGNVDLGAATLDVTLGFPSSAGETFTIISGNTNSTNSTFAGLSDGTVFTAGGIPFRINYSGGDVVLTNVSTATTCTWSGGGGAANDNWTNPANWDVLPSPGDILVFSGSTPLTSTDDFPAGTIFQSITFSGSGYIVNGANNIVVGVGGISSVGDNTFKPDITLLTGETFHSAGGTLTISGALDTNGSDLDVIGDATFNGAISGAGALTLSSGTVTLTGASTYSGGTTASTGTLVLGSSTALGTGTLTIDSGENIQALSTFAPLANDVTINGSFNIVGTSDLTFAGPTTLMASPLISVAPLITATFAGAIDDGGAGNGLMLGSGGTLVLAGANTYTGVTEVDSADLRISGSVSGDTIVDSGTLEIDTPALGAGTLILNSVANVAAINGPRSVSNAVSIAGDFNVIGNNDLTFTGPVTLNTSSSTIGLTGSTGITTFSGDIGEGGPGNGLTAMGGTLVLSGNNTYTGGTTITSGLLEIGSDTALGTGTLTVDGGTLAVIGGPRTLANDASLNADTTIDLSGSSGSTTLTGTIGGSFGLTTAGGTLVLTGTNTYTGNTTVSSGTLLVDGSLVSPTVVNSAATLGGTGAVQAVSSVGGTISPGDPVTSTAILNSGDLTLNAASHFTVQLNGTTAGSQYDQVNVTGNVILNGATLDGTVGTVNAGNTFTIMTFTGTLTGTFAEPFGPNVVFIGGQKFTVSYTAPNVMLTRVLANTTITVVSSANPSVFSEGVTFTAQVTPEPAAPGAPTGFIDFVIDGGSNLVAVNAATGQATFTTSTLTVGPHTIFAKYLGDTVYSPSLSASLTQTVNQDTTTAALSTSSNPSPVGNLVTFTTIVTANAPGLGTPTGAVVFVIDTQPPVTVLLDAAGQASLATSSLTVGNHTINATYAGDANYFGSLASPLTQTVNTQPPVFTSPDSTTFTVGASGSFTVTASGGPPPSIVLSSGTLPAGVNYVNSGNGTGTLSGIPAAGSGGTYSLTFTAANGVAPNALQTFTLTVNQAPTITSANTTTFTAGTFGTFTVTTTGVPPAGLTVSGTLPAGVSFADLGNGKGKFTGTATVAGSYPLSIIASNGVLPDASQNFTLVVKPGPPGLITIGSGNNQTTVVNHAFPTPLSVTVTDTSGNPLGGVVVTFLSPTSGASTSWNGVPVTAVTDAQGRVTIAVAANSIVGSYTVTAKVPATSGLSAAFDLKNILGKAVWNTAIAPNGGDWDDPKNWLLGGGTLIPIAGIPGPLDDALIDGLNAGAVVFHKNGTDAVHSVTSTAIVDQQGGSLDILAPSSFTSLVVSGGSLTGPGDLKISDRFLWNGGVLGPSVIAGNSAPGGNIFSAGDMVIGGNIASVSPLVLDNRQIFNSGNAAFVGSNSVQGTRSAALINTGSFNYNAAADFLAFFNNQGNFAKNAPGFAQMTVFANRGQVGLSAGMLHVYVYNQFAGSTFLLGGGLGSPNPVAIRNGSLAGPGLINAALFNDGVIAPGPFGSLRVTGNYVQGGGGALAFQINGATPGSNFGQLSVGGNVTLAGVIALAFGNGFIPTADQTFTLLLFAGSGTGQFSAVLGGTPSAAVNLIPLYNAFDVTLLTLSNAQVIDNLIASSSFLGNMDGPPAPANDLLNPLLVPTLNGIVQIPIGFLASEAKVQSGGGQANSNSAGLAASPSALLRLPKASGVDKVGDYLEEATFDRLQPMFDDFDLPAEKDALTGADIAGSLLTGAKPRANLLPQKGARVAPVATLLTGDHADGAAPGAQQRTDDGLRDSLINPIEKQKGSHPAEGPTSQAPQAPKNIALEEQPIDLGAYATPEEESNPAAAALAAVLVTGTVVHSDKKRRT